VKWNVYLAPFNSAVSGPFYPWLQPQISIVVVYCWGRAKQQVAQFSAPELVHDATRMLFHVNNVSTPRVCQDMLRTAAANQHRFFRKCVTQQVSPEVGPAFELGFAPGVKLTGDDANQLACLMAVAAAPPLNLFEQDNEPHATTPGARGGADKAQVPEPEPEPEQGQSEERAGVQGRTRHQYRSYVATRTENLQHSIAQHSNCAPPPHSTSVQLQAAIMQGKCTKKMHQLQLLDPF
jgi:hypothetical protein